MGPSYNNSFGNSPIISSGQGDVILTPSGMSVKKNGKRRGLIIAAVVLILVAIGVGVAAVIVGGRGNDKGASYEELFNVYANYILYGEESSQEINEYDYNDVYKIDSQVKNADYLSRAMTYYRNFYNAAVSANRALFWDLSLDASMNDLEYLVEYAGGGIGFIAESDIVKIYLESGSEAAKSEVEKVTANAQSAMARSMQELNKEMMLAKIAYWDVYAGQGCVVNGAFNMTCVAAISSELLDEVAVQLGAVKMEYDGMPMRAVNDLKWRCAEMREALYGVNNG